MAEDKERHNPLAKLSNVGLSPQDRQDVWQEIELRMQQMEQLRPRQRRNRVLRRVMLSSAFGVAAAVVVGLVINNGWLSGLTPMQESKTPPSHVAQPSTPATPTQPQSPTKPMQP
ncbi:MAG: hypothetical protein ACXVOI_10225, partial [Tumebacillaceae bacterium]